MSDEVKQSGIAPANPNTNPNRVNDATTREAADAVNRSGQPIQRHSAAITNVKQPEAEAEIKDEDRKLPQSTIDEMAAGKSALERNKPVASALEAARAKQDKAKNPNATTAPSNPVDATAKLQKTGQV